MKTPDQLVHWTSTIQAASIMRMGAILPLADPNTTPFDPLQPDTYETIKVSDDYMVTRRVFDEPGVVWLTEEDDPYLEGMLGEAKGVAEPSTTYLLPARLR